MFVSCNDCGTHYLDPLDPLVPPEVLFDKYPWTQRYSAQYESYLPLCVRSLEAKLVVCETITGVRPSTMLDVGCGNGLFLHAGKRLGLTVVGTEVDAGSAALAIQNGLPVEIGKLEGLDIPGQFDFIHIRMVVHLCPSPVSLLQTVVEKLASGGVVYVDGHHQDGLFSRLRRIVAQSRRHYGQLIYPTHCVAFTNRSFGTLLERSGLTPLRTFTYSAGDPIYYPGLPRSAKDQAARLVKAGLDRMGMGALLAAYCVKTHEQR